MMKLKKLAVLFTAAVLCAAVTAGCRAGQKEDADKAAAGGTAGTAKDTKKPQTTEEEEENYDTGDASLDNTRNQDGIGEREILTVSFGTSYNDSRRLTIGAIEEAIEEAFPEYSVRRGFTSQIIIDHIKSRDKAAIDNVEEALARAEKNGVKYLAIQPTHLMNGLEYQELEETAAEYADAFVKIAVGAPLLTEEEDFRAVMKAITDETKEFDDGETAICFMGHGTEAESNQVYTKMQRMLSEAGFKNYYIGTVEAKPGLNDVKKMVEAGDYKKVVLAPLMIVAGDHANQDMAGEDEDSWKSVFENAGYEVTCLIQGLGELPEIQKLFIKHAQDAVDGLEE